MEARKIKKIAITGGKGGTGKSTVSILLLNQFLQEGKKVVLCDCDVECPNDYLLLGEKLKSPRQKTYTEFPYLIKSKCRKCGICAKTCKSHAIFAPPGRYPIFIKDLCLGCGACQMVCPFGAIRTKKEETGKIYLNEIKNQKSKIKTKNQSSKLKNLINFYLVTGVAKAGLEETGPIVEQARKFALDFAKKIKADVVLFDTAAGTHCPVIHALIDVNFAYIVAEPTPMGAHDLSLVLELCKKLRVPVKIILNQSDLGDQTMIKKIVKKHKLTIEKEIPYSKKIAKDYAQGKLLNFLF